VRAGDVETLLGDIEEFLTGHRESSLIDIERVLSSVLLQIFNTPCRHDGRSGTAAIAGHS